MNTTVMVTLTTIRTILSAGINQIAIMSYSFDIRFLTAQTFVNIMVDCYTQKETLRIQF